MAIRLATWNVNSLRQRLDHLARFAAELAPDLICLQETKVTDDLFPREAVHAMGYPHLLVHGQQDIGRRLAVTLGLGDFPSVRRGR